MRTATELLESAPPTEVTGRQIAEAAGVNHGQIHHYFGSKDGLIAATIADAAARYSQERLRDGLVFPLPIETLRRTPAWRTLAYLAATGHWRQPPYEPSPVVASLARRRAQDLGVEISSPEVMADVAATMALQRGWWIFQDIIEVALAEYKPKIAKVRTEVARRSLRLIDDSIPVADTPQPQREPTLPRFPADAAPPRGREEVRERLVLAAVHLLADAPPNSVTTKQIAALAQVNHGQVHHYFHSKEHLVASALRVGSTAILNVMDASATAPVVPIQAERHPPLWRTLAHIASTEEWVDEVYDRSPVVRRMVEVVAARTGEPVTSVGVHAQVAVVHALELGWAVYRNIIEYGLEALGGDLSAMRRRLAAISVRLVDQPVRQ